MKIDELNKQEHKRLQEIIKGYGKLKYASDVSGINTKTLERIAVKGRGLEEFIELIRTKLLEIKQTN